MKLVAILLCSVLLTFSQETQPAQEESTQTTEQSATTTDNTTVTDSNSTTNTTGDSQSEQQVAPESQCPAWKCEQLYHAEARYCFYRKNSTSDVVVNEQYNNTQDACYLTDIFNKEKAKEQGKQDEKYAVSRVRENEQNNQTTNETDGNDDEFKQLTSCSEQDVTELRAKFQCNAYCKQEQTTQNVTLASGFVYLKKSSQKNCSYDDFEEAYFKTSKQNHGELEWLEECGSDKECTSGECVCVPATEEHEKRGRCSAGVGDELHEQLWYAVCNANTPLEDVCDLIFLKKNTPIIAQLVHNALHQDLQCLSRFNDFHEFDQIYEEKVEEEHKDKKGKKLIVLVVVLVLVGAVVLAVSLYCCCRKKNEDYNSIN